MLRSTRRLLQRRRASHWRRNSARSSRFSPRVLFGRLHFSPFTAALCALCG
jgi:hypothetical protein